MNNIKLLEELTTIEFKAAKNDPTFITDMMQLTKAIREEIAKESAKKAGTAQLLKYAKQIIKTLPPHMAERLNGICKVNEYYVVCDTYKLLALQKPLQLPELSIDNFPADMCKKILSNYDYIENYQAVELPELSELKIYITEEKTFKKVAGNKTPVLYNDINIDNITINAEWLLQAIQAGFNKCYYKERMFYLMDENGNKNIICGVYAK